MTDHIRFDLRDFQRVAQSLGAKLDQVPFALANAMNDAAKVSRQHLVQDVWPSHVQVRAGSFMGAALRTQFATKGSLAVEVYDHLGRANLDLHADGGTRASHGRNLAIPPTGSVRRTARGVPQSQRPRAIIANTPKRALRITARGILVGEMGKLKLKYALRPSARIKPDVPFRREFADAMQYAIGPFFDVRIRQAMATRRAR